MASVKKAKSVFNLSLKESEETERWTFDSDSQPQTGKTEHKGVGFDSPQMRVVAREIDFGENRSRREFDRKKSSARSMFNLNEIGCGADDEVKRNKVERKTSKINATFKNLFETVLAPKEAPPSKVSDEEAKKCKLRKTKSLRLTPSSVKKFDLFELDSNRKLADESDSMASRDLETTRKDVKKKKRRKKSSGSNSVLAASVTIEASEDVRSANGTTIFVDDASFKFRENLAFHNHRSRLAEA